MFRFSVVSFLITFTSAARADDLDDLLNEPEEEDLGGDEPAPAPAPTGPEDDLGPKEEEDPDVFGPADDTDLLGEDADAAPVAGADTADAYRNAQEQAKGMFAEEEAAFWESYLQQYPNTQFRDRIQSHIDDLMAELYGRRIDTGDGSGDAMDQEIRFSQGMLLSNIDPRTRIQFGLEWGNPDWVNLFADYEHQLARPISIHGGVFHRYAGWAVEAGARWAPVKSTRTGTILTFIGDLRLNTQPAFPAIRPQIGFGQRFGKLDAQIQAGTDLELRDGVQLVVLGGANLEYRATETVGVFLESQVHAKGFTWDGGDTFRFQTVTLGLKFHPLAGQREDLDFSLAGTAPYSQQYWQHHFGAIMAQGNYWID